MFLFNFSLLYFIIFNGKIKELPCFIYSFNLIINAAGREPRTECSINLLALACHRRLPRSAGAAAHLFSLD
jgi:hypothetical protein